MSKWFLASGWPLEETSQAEGQNPEALQAKFDGVVRQTGQKLLTFLEAATENFCSFEQWEFLIHKCHYR